MKKLRNYLKSSDELVKKLKEEWRNWRNAEEIDGQVKQSWRNWGNSEDVEVITKILGSWFGKDEEMVNK